MFPIGGGLCCGPVAFPPVADVGMYDEVFCRFVWFSVLKPRLTLFMTPSGTAQKSKEQLRWINLKSHQAIHWGNNFPRGDTELLWATQCGAVMILWCIGGELNAPWSTDPNEANQPFANICAESSHQEVRLNNSLALHIYAESSHQE